MEAKRERRSETFIDKHMHKPKGLRNSNFWPNNSYNGTKVNFLLNPHYKITKTKKPKFNMSSSSYLVYKCDIFDILTLCASNRID